jgi:recombinational DNA repair protein (RecF pathway)
LLACFLRENGLRYVLARTRQTRPASLPDLFATGDLLYEQKDPARPAFLREFTAEAEYAAIGSHYKRLQAASRITRFYERNLLHMETYAAAWTLLQAALAALAAKPAPEVVLLKTLFQFARHEGYPVHAHWLAPKAAAERAAISTVLRQPLDGIDCPQQRVSDWTTDLLLFFGRETDLLPPDC